MKRYFYLLLLLLGGLYCSRGYAQSLTEFEGSITYKHSVSAIKKGYNIKRDLAYFGNGSEIQYKEGDLRWNYRNGRLNTDLYHATDSIEFLTLTGSDTVFYTRNNYPNEEIEAYHTADEGGTVLGVKCRVFVITTAKGGHKWTRKFYYNIAKTPVNPTRFRKYRINSMYVVYSTIQSLPLKIEYIFEDRKVTFTAIKITPAKLDPAIFELNPEWPRKRL